MVGIIYDIYVLLCLRYEKKVLSLQGNMLFLILLVNER